MDFFKIPLVSKKNIFYLTLVLFYIGSTTYVTHLVESFMRQKQVEKFLGYAPSYAISFEEMGHEFLNENTQEKDPLFLKLIDYEKKWLKANPYITDIYTMKRNKSGQIVLIVDSETDYNRDGEINEDREGQTAIGEVYEKTLPELENAFLGQASFTKEAYADRWGTWVSAFVPLKTKSGKVDGILGVDFPYETYIREINIARTVAFWGSVLLSLSVFVLLLMNEQHKKNSRDLNFARKKAEEAAKVKTAFLANMSHEIRTPLNGILGMVSLLSDRNLDQETREQINILKNSGEGLMSLVNDILDFSKIEAGKLVLSPSDFDLVHTLNEVISIFEISASQKGLKLIFVNKSEEFYVIKMDQNRLRQVMMNLIGNAIKFTSQGSVSVIVGTALESESQVKVEIRVVDTGIGIDEDSQKKLFRSFSQVDASTTRRFGGTGLGLAICKGIIESFGGRIALKSEPGRGSEFVINFSAPIGSASLLEIKKSEPEPLKKYDHLQVLVADDVLTNRILATRFLEKLGCHVECVQNGLEVVEIVQRKKFDIIFMDGQMPEMDGFMATSRVKEIYRDKSCPWIVALTAGVLEEDKKKCFDVGMQDFVSKPFDIQSLSNALEKWRLSRNVKVPTSTKIFQLDVFRQQFGEDVDIMYDFINSFLKTEPEMRRNLELAIQQKDRSLVNRLAHKLKGTTGYFYIPTIDQCLASLEEADVILSWEDIENKFEKLKKELVLLEKELEDISVKAA